MVVGHILNHYLSTLGLQTMTKKLAKTYLTTIEYQHL